MRCGRIEKLLSLYLDQELDESGKTLVEQHLETCDQCRQTLAELQSISHSIRTIPPVLAPPRFEDVVISTLKVEATEIPTPYLTRFFSFTQSRFALVAASAVCLLLLSLLSLQVMPLLTGTTPEYPGSNSGQGNLSTASSMPAREVPLHSPDLSLGSNFRNDFAIQRVGFNGDSQPFVIDHGLRSSMFGPDSEDNVDAELEALITRYLDAVPVKSDNRQITCVSCEKQLENLSFLPRANLLKRSQRVRLVRTGPDTWYITIGE